MRSLDQSVSGTLSVVPIFRIPNLSKAVTRRTLRRVTKATKATRAVARRRATALKVTSLTRVIDRTIIAATAGSHQVQAVLAAVALVPLAQAVLQEVVNTWR